MNSTAPQPARRLRVRRAICRPAHRWSPDVRLIEMPAGLRLADFGRDRFYALNGTAAELAELALRSGPRRAVRTLAQKYAVPVAQVRRDWLALSAELVGRGLIEPLAESRLPARDPLTAGQRRSWRACLRRAIGRQAARTLGAIAEAGRTQSPAHVPAWRVKCLLWAAWLAVRSQSWHATIQAWGGGSAHGEAARSTGDGATLLSTVHERVIAGAATTWLPVACKERALVAWRLLRRAGQTAELVIGVADHPFRAHAWVECDGSVLTDDPAHCEPFRPVVRYGGPLASATAHLVR